MNRRNRPRVSGMQKPARDIRATFVHLSEDGVSHYLQRNGPACPADSGATHSGIACLTMVIRVILSYVGKEHWDRESDTVKQEEAANPFLRFAWLAFRSPIFEDQETALKELIAGFWGPSMNQLIEADRAQELTFDFLVNSDQMRRTVWSWLELQSFAPFLWAPANVNQLLEYDPASAPEALTRFLQPFYPTQLPSTMKCMLYPTTDLSEEVNKFFRAVALPL
ncbi:hypothetical protein QQZ08_007087 [Neonectria magnoliae]|uniref:Uncharacterized protein n=1 Tax=Neonectria magnoliae TaxID=2732573 RepID=A0ABR1HZ61_9HYPO